MGAELGSGGVCIGGGYCTPYKIQGFGIGHWVEFGSGLDAPSLLKTDCQPKTHTLECVLVQVGSWGLHVVVHLHNISMCNSNHSIGINIKHTTFYSRFKR